VHAVIGADGGGLRHLALFYRGQDEYRAQILRFARSALARGEPSYIAVPGDEARLFGDQLSAEPGDVVWSDMANLGRNPARIIPELRAFIDRHPGQHVSFVGEPIWPGRSPSEICEATRHEALINLAFAEDDITILCPYDTARLAPSATAGARRTHPATADGRPTADADRAAAGQVPPECDGPLSPPPAGAESLTYRTDLAPVRRLVESHARSAGLSAERAGDLVLAVSEVAANSLGHTESGGVLQVWHDEYQILCEARDQGWIADPLAGRVRHGPESRGHGLFLVNHVCDLVEVRTGPAGTTVRLHMDLREPSPV
jgi:anti-sigma regulatory factor (Ser/Thr protein kinase)